MQLDCLSTNVLHAVFNKETCCTDQGNKIVARSMLHAMLPVECHKTYSTNSTKIKPVGNTMSQHKLKNNTPAPPFLSLSLYIHISISYYYGLKCKIPPVKNRGSIGSKRDNFLSVKGPKLFNILPASIRNSLGSDILAFKKNLDKFLSTVPDEPSVQGYSSGRAAASNSLLDQVRHRRAWTETGPQG